MKAFRAIGNYESALRDAEVALALMDNPSVNAGFYQIGSLPQKESFKYIKLRKQIQELQVNFKL